MPRYKDPTIIKDCSIKTRKKHTSIKCPNCKTNGFIVSIFGSICSNCLHTEEGVVKSKTLEEMKICDKCGKKLKLIKGQTHSYFCSCSPNVRISIG